jgi:hypothetical protein
MGVSTEILENHIDPVSGAVKTILYDAAGNQFDPLTDTELRAAPVPIDIIEMSIGQRLSNEKET